MLHIARPTGLVPGERTVDYVPDFQPADTGHSSPSASTHHRQAVSTKMLLRCLLSLDYVLEYTGSPWLPAEFNKIHAFEALGIELRHLPRTAH